MATSLPGPQRQPLQQFMPRTELTMQQAVRAQLGSVQNQGQMVVGGDLAQQQVLALRSALPNGMQNDFQPLTQQQNGQRRAILKKPGLHQLQPLTQQQAQAIQMSGGFPPAMLSGVPNPPADYASIPGFFAYMPPWDERMGTVTPFGVAAGPEQAVPTSAMNALGLTNRPTVSARGAVRLGTSTSTGEQERPNWWVIFDSSMLWQYPNQNLPAITCGPRFIIEAQFWLLIASCDMVTSGMYDSCCAAAYALAYKKASEICRDLKQQVSVDDPNVFERRVCMDFSDVPPGTRGFPSFGCQRQAAFRCLDL